MGVAYVRTCQVPARAGRPSSSGIRPMRIRHCRRRVRHVDEIAVERRVVERVVDRRRARRRVAPPPGDGDLVLDAHDGIEVVGIYPGPTVIARTPDGVLHVEADEIVVATGAAEIQPVCPGNDLDGLLTPRAADRLVGHAGIDLAEPVRTGRAGARPVRGRRPGGSRRS